MAYSFPPHYPKKDCPPDSCGESCGIYYRVVSNLDKDDSEHYKSYYDLKRGRNWNTCKARALSMCLTEAQAKGVMANLGDASLRFIAKFNLSGGHGLVQIDNQAKGHCSWWVPLNVLPSIFWAD